MQDHGVLAFGQGRRFVFQVKKGVKTLFFLFFV